MAIFEAILKFKFAFAIYPYGIKYKAINPELTNFMFKSPINSACKSFNVKFKTI